LFLYYSRISIIDAEFVIFEEFMRHILQATFLYS